MKAIQLSENLFVKMDSKATVVGIAPLVSDISLYLFTFLVPFGDF